MALSGKSKGAKAKKAADKRLKKAKGTASKGADNALDWAGPRLTYAKDVAAASAADARKWAEPRLESARRTVNTEVVPRVQGTLSEVQRNAGPAFEEAKARGGLAVAALRGQQIAPPPPKKKHRGRKVLLVLLGAAVVGGVGVAVWSRRNAEGFDYYSLPADDFGGAAGDGVGYGSDSPLGSVTSEPTRAGEPADQLDTPDTGATEAAENADDDGSGKHRRDESS